MAKDGGPGLNPSAMPIEEAAKVLSIAVDVLRDDIRNGAPTNADGTINIVHYAAWLNKELMRKNGTD